jgi:outer membrane protein assembly factor BamB
VVYIGSNDGNFYAINAINGRIIWQYQTGGNVQSSPAVAGNVVYIGSDNNEVFALITANPSG